MVFEVRDLWPQSAVQLGELRNPWAKRLASRLEESCYRRARRIVVVTDGIKGRLLDRGYPGEKLVMIPNGANTEIYSPREPDKELGERLGIGPDQFVAIYTGLHGLAQGLETILETASRLRSESGIVFLLLGDGPRKEALVKQAEKMKLPNVVFHDAVPERELPRYLSVADVGLHTLRRLDVSAIALPAKIFSYMACGLPVILAMEGEAARLLQEADGGIAVEPESPEALADALLQLKAAPAQRERYGFRGVEFVRANYSRQELAKRLAALLDEVDREGSRTWPEARSHRAQ
jgi:glycosyltransferase involved in cell wall biosynthesis